MPPPPHQKPENVLKRAHELIGVNQAPAALTLLHDHITSKRSRNVPIASLEPVMLLLVELSVEQKKGKVAKDALYSYKNIAQNTNIATIELVLKKFIELAADKVTVAQKKADEVQESIDATATASVDDLEASETPEAIVLATVSGEQSRDRTERAVVTPWLKFLWEAYRTVLDILRNNARLELLYQSTAMQAFDFCLKYQRKTEFRRLCELLRNHLQTAQKYSSQMHAINLNDPDTLQRHLETRFQQLNVAVELELWQEAFRSVEDIHGLLKDSKRPAKPVMMANYYEKLTRIFLVGENYLFHAAAWSRYYNLLRQSSAVVATGQGKKADNPSASEADLQKAASFVILSALSIPVISTSRSRGAMVDFDEARKNKNSRTVQLLSMSVAPTRDGLVAFSKSLLKRARPEIRELYNILEVDFHPLSICEKISPILTKIGTDSEMEKYIGALQQVILTRLFQQLSQVYESVDVAFVENLANFPEPFQVTRSTMEKFIMNGNKKGDLSIRMDYSTGVLHFDKDVFASSRAVHTGSAAGSAESQTGTVQRLQRTPSDIVRSQLSRLMTACYTVSWYTDPSLRQRQEEARKVALTRAKAGAEAEHRETLARKEVIQKRKEEASEALAKREKEKARQKRLQEQALAEAEERRLTQEQREREEKRLRDERDRVRKEELKKQIADLKLGPGTVDIDVENLNDIDIRAMKLAQLEREKNDIKERLRVTGKRIDHLERALRKEEVKKLPEDYAKQRERDVAAYETMKSETLQESKEKHKESVELKHRLTRMMPLYDSFKKSVRDRRRDEFEKRQRDAERELEKQIGLRKKEYRDRKIREKRERDEQERALREAEERAQREKEEQEKRAEQKRADMARLKEQRDKERQESLEKAALQARREEEAMARRKEKERAAAPAPRREPFSMDRSDSNGRPSGPPRLQLAGNKPSWRERQAAAAAAAGDGRDAPETTESNEPPRERPTERSFERPVERATERPTERPVEPPSERSSAGPRRLQLAGQTGKPSWRDREAARQASSGSPAPAGEARDSSPAGEALKPSGAPGKWVPRHRQGA
ncbi:eukaryotic translation initiation factor 3 subunit A [Xylariaceae sp. FL0804]|nr:eukaryotic translation initiation factor 3 subunit A [Xylariaceae sp. FL0804]